MIYHHHHFNDFITAAIITVAAAAAIVAIPGVLVAKVDIDIADTLENIFDTAINAIVLYHIHHITATVFGMTATIAPVDWVMGWFFRMVEC